jgi:hypothetical protein
VANDSDVKDSANVDDVMNEIFQEGQQFRTEFTELLVHDPSNTIKNGKITFSHGDGTDVIYSRHPKELDLALSQAYKLANYFAEGGEPGFVNLVINNTDNAAFQELGRTEEISRIIREAAQKIGNEGCTPDFPLHDVNGNKVGRIWEFEFAHDKPSEGEVVLSISLESAAFEFDDENRLHEIAFVLNDAARNIQAGTLQFDGCSTVNAFLNLQVSCVPVSLSVLAVYDHQGIIDEIIGIATRVANAIPELIH